MSNHSLRVSKLEPKPHDQDRFEDVSLRLMRYMIERHHQVTERHPDFAKYSDSPGNPAWDEIYARVQTHPRFAEMQAEVNSGNFIYSKS